MEQLKRLEALTAAIPAEQVEDVREDIVGELFKNPELCEAVTVTNRELLYRSERLDRIFKAVGISDHAGHARRYFKR